MMNYFAHTDRSVPPNPERWQPLSLHLEQVASLAKTLALTACPGDDDLAKAAELAGLLHDLGKFRQEFQEYLRGYRNKSEATRHKYPGAARAWYEHQRADVAFAIAGHHGELPCQTALGEGFRSITGRDSVAGIWDEATSVLPVLKTVQIAPCTSTNGFDFHTRLLFSCLVDADWTDTSDYYDSLKGYTAEPPPKLESERLFLNLRKHLDELNSRTGLEPAIRDIRSQILDASIEAAEKPPGLFSMSVPTGGGKTLSSMAFALRHAQLHGLRRIIYVAPYLSIIEQNARIIRESLGPGSEKLVFEHHSLTEPIDRDLSDERKDANQRQAENWSSPIVITTSVQFFESLFANQPGQCRKLHNIARSVVILDECQTLPVELITPTCDMLQSVCAKLGTTIVLATATQPGWSTNEGLLGGLKRVREMMPASLDLYGRLKRVHVHFPVKESPKWTWEEVASRMAESPAALAIVNTKAAAVKVYQTLTARGVSGAFHLSTNMCPAHRLKVIGEVKRRLAAGEECRLVSTQLIQAGVDVDFPFVLREMAPLDDVIQSAGRCNREGKLKNEDGSPGGHVIVFEHEDGNTLQAYKFGIDALEKCIQLHPDLTIDSQGDLQVYFEFLYNAKNLDARKIQESRAKFDFPQVAADYRLIKDDTEAVVVLNYDKRRAEIEALLAQHEQRPSRGILQALSKYQVNVRLDSACGLSGMIESRDRDWGIKLYIGPYDPQLGIAGGDFIV